MLKLGHRGASAAAPENTLSAFRAAIELGADGVELDVHRCKSGELVVIHDDTVDRTTNGSGAVAQMRFDELSSLRINGTERIALLEEVLVVMTGKYVFIEVKHPDAAHAAAAQMGRLVENGWPPERLWLISFRHEALLRVLEDYPSLNIGASFETLEPDSILKAHAMGVRAIIPHHQPLQEKQVREAQALGLKVFCWTVNDAGDIARLKTLQVDGIMSDYPERL